VATSRRCAIGTLVIVSVLGSIALTAPQLEAGIDIEEARPLPWVSLDKLLFFFDINSFPTDSTTSRTEFYIRVPGNELTHVDSLEDAQALVRYELKLKNVKGKTILKEKHEVPVPPAETDDRGFSLGHVFLIAADLTPGWYEAEIKLEDRYTQKVGLAYMGREVHQDGKIKGIFRVPEFSSQNLQMSQLEAVWSIVPAEQRTRFTRGRVNVFPNPSRTYGLYQTQATVYYEISDPVAEERTVQVTTRIVDLEGNVLHETGPNTLPVTGRSWSQATFDVSSLLSGAYDLEVLLEGGEGEVVHQRTRLNIAWWPQAWRGDPRAQVDEVHFLVNSEDEEEAFIQLSLGEQEAYLDAYWKTRDPDPDTPRNEARERFQERVAFANRSYGFRGIEKGMFTDRGRIYIRYGPPDEIRNQDMPTHGLQVEDLARQIAIDQGSEFAAPLRAESQDVGPRRPMQRVYVFVDEEGYGNYVLRYQND
jgi:GWxTD domain-containing protein